MKQFLGVNINSCMHNVTHDTFEPIEMVQKVAAVTFYPI